MNFTVLLFTIFSVETECTIEFYCISPRKISNVKL